MATIEIDGKKIEAPAGSMIIEVADEHDIYIPRFCYHKKLSIAANCRMCLVEVEKAPKTVPACATPITDGMKVSTCSDKAKYSQKAVMEFLLINHPLDCPICDQGGECELQDLSMSYGDDVSRYTEGKRSVDSDNLGSLIATEMTRCIHCTRCVRFGEEVAGFRELGATGRGEDMQIGTYIQHSVASEVSGNIIDLCPVGALTSRPYRFSARSWELNQHNGIAAHDCLGSNLHVHTRRGQVMRVVPRENEAVNETWISDRDRFSYVGLSHQQRAAEPEIKINGQWQKTDWQSALKHVVERTRSLINDVGQEQIATLMSANSTTEECYLAQKLMRAIKVDNIDYRLRASDFADDDAVVSYPGTLMNYAEVEHQQAILIVGADIQREQPLAALRVRKAQTHGASVMAINNIDYDFHFTLTHKVIIKPDAMLEHCAKVAKAIIDKTEQSFPQDFLDLLANVSADQDSQDIAQTLLDNDQSCIVMGAQVEQHPQAASLRGLLNFIAKFSQSHIIQMTEGANSAGAWLANAKPDVAGLSAQQALQQGLKAYFLMHCEPEFDVDNPQQALNALQQAELVVCMTPFVSEQMRDYADVILPVTPFTETSGTFVNVAGQWQTFKAVTAPFGEARPAWKVWRVLGNLFGVSGFDYNSSEEVLAELKQMHSHLINAEKLEDEKQRFVPKKLYCPEKITAGNGQLQRIARWPIYRVDNIVRRAQPLQDSASAEQVCVRINSQTAKQQKIQDKDFVTVEQNGQAVELPLQIDDRIADNAVYIAHGFAQSSQLGTSFGEVKLIG